MTVCVACWYVRLRAVLASLMVTFTLSADRVMSARLSKASTWMSMPRTPGVCFTRPSSGDVNGFRARQVERRSFALGGPGGEGVAQQQAGEERVPSGLLVDHGG